LGDEKREAGGDQRAVPWRSGCSDPGKGTDVELNTELLDGNDAFNAKVPSVALLFKRFYGEPLTPEEQASWDAYEKEVEEVTARREALGVVDLGDVMLGGDTEPEMLVDGLFVREKHHLVYGKKESGKTWLLLHAAAELVRRGEPVVWVDEEMGRRDMADRLRWMQLDPEAVSGLFTYLEMPMLNGSRESLALWTALLQVKRPSLVAVDAQTEVLASADLNENSGTDVAKWHAWYLAPALRLGAATVVIDHTGHDEQERARGSGHKGAQSKVELSVKREGKKFTKSSLGVIEVRETKNTPAAPIPTKQFFELGGEPGPNGNYVFAFRSTVKTGAEGRDKAELDRRLRIIAAVGRAAKPPSKTAIHDRIGGNKQANLRLIDAMVDEGTLIGQEGSRGTVYTVDGQVNE
jgi:AAA domain